MINTPLSYNLSSHFKSHLKIHFSSHSHHLFIGWNWCFTKKESYRIGQCHQTSFAVKEIWLLDYPNPLHTWLLLCTNHQRKWDDPPNSATRQIAVYIKQKPLQQPPILLPINLSCVHNSPSFFTILLSSSSHSPILQHPLLSPHSSASLKPSINLYFTKKFKHFLLQSSLLQAHFA